MNICPKCDGRGYSSKKDYFNSVECDECMGEGLVGFNPTSFVKGKPSRRKREEESTNVNDTKNAFRGV